ncbi:exosome complex component MTR3-like [Mya arenaria]|uniref:exosome complex component MTR3-like n=1 Tax=Mya arenaria TaxID=6604 RepID=UPI0022E080EF|nr:exosome complex component MTR3-like [Mya arenaria]XP_052817396.1 exosome complex component MTR3-like [Mya arenaria]
MPTDTRRINGPESSISPYAFVKSKQLTDKAAESGRSDGRTFEKVRPIFLKTGLITQAQGSSYIEQDGTKVICAVYGPRAVIKREEFSMQGQMTCEFKFAPFSCRQRRQHMQDAEEKDYSVQLLEALEPAVLLHKFPKAQVNIYITVLQNDGSALAASMTCASMALADAGIEMYDLVTGCSARIKGDTILMDPCSSEEYSDKDSATVNNGSVTVGIMPSLNQISAVTSKGELHFEHLRKAIRQCVDVCIQLYPVCQQSLTSAVEDLIQKGSDT